MKLLTFSTLFPSAVRPGHGIFVETRLRQLLMSGEVEANVVAPVPWFPSVHHCFGAYASFARTPFQEVRHGIHVLHPRYLVLPKIGMNVSPYLLALAAKPVLQKMIAGGNNFDIIDAHYFYPDGVAAVLLGRLFNKPVMITARGSDINLIANYLIPRKMIRWAAKSAAAVISVCEALKDKIVALGVPIERVHVLRNGVDLHFFRPLERQALRTQLGLAQITLLSVGNLVPLKGHDLVIRAMALLPNARVLIVGEGPERRRLEDLALKVNVADRVTFLGSLGQDNLRDYYCAVDALVLASSREGMANVLLESLACGTPVVATNVSGTPEVVAAPEAGVLLEERSPQAIAEGVINLLSKYPSHLSTRQFAEQFSWDKTTRGQLAVFEKIINDQRSRSRYIRG